MLYHYQNHYYYYYNYYQHHHHHLTSRHLGQTPGDLPESLGPSRSGVSHHAHVVTHIPEVLGQSDS